MQKQCNLSKNATENIELTTSKSTHTQMHISKWIKDHVILAPAAAIAHCGYPFASWNCTFLRCKCRRRFKCMARINALSVRGTNFIHIHIQSHIVVRVRLRRSRHRCINSGSEWAREGGQSAARRVFLSIFFFSLIVNFHLSSCRMAANQASKTKWKRRQQIAFADMLLCVRLWIDYKLREAIESHKMWPFAQLMFSLFSFIYYIFHNRVVFHNIRTHAIWIDMICNIGIARYWRRGILLRAQRFVFVANMSVFECTLHRNESRKLNCS